MSGLRIVTIYIGIAWFLAGTGALWSGISLYRAGSDATDGIHTQAAKDVTELQAERETLEKELSEKIASEKKGRDEAQETLDGIAEDDKKGQKAAKADVDKAQKAVDKAEKQQKDDLAALDQKIKDREEQRDADLEALEKSGSKAAFPWKPIPWLILGIGLIAVGIFVLKPKGGAAKPARASTPAADPEFTKAPKEAPSPAPIDDDEDTPPPA